MTRIPTGLVLVAFALVSCSVKYDDAERGDTDSARGVSDAADREALRADQPMKFAPPRITPISETRESDFGMASTYLKDYVTGTCYLLLRDSSIGVGGIAPVDCDRIPMSLEWYNWCVEVTPNEELYDTSGFPSDDSPCKP